MSQIFVSKNNSTTVPLGAGQSFTGQFDVLTSWQELDINVAGSPSNAPGTLTFEFSPDGTHWDTSVPLTLSGPNIIPVTLRTVLPYFRVIYVNGITPQTEFRLTTIFHRGSSKQLSRFLSQPIDENEPIENVRVAEGERSTIGTTTTVDASATNVTLLALNTSRTGATIFNDSLQILYVKLGITASTSSFTVRILPNGYYETPFGYTGEIDGIWDGASGNARITEFT
ncbi:MAG TPA: hypothetical protein VM577_14080 [Anaerovoracaceae bacterium]|nr:hypothetical protein [Anaerovoracaceae bacterium]